MRNRYYSPVLGRWISRDPIGYEGGINLYEYVVSNSAVYTDPSGRCLSCWLMSVEFALIPAEASFAVYDSRAILVSLLGGEAAEQFEIATFLSDLGVLAGTVKAFYYHANECQRCNPCASNLKKVAADKKAVGEKVNSVWEDAKKVWEAVKKAGEIIRDIPEP